MRSTYSGKTRAGATPLGSEMLAIMATLEHHLE
jgi:hypothetical protein